MTIEYVLTGPDIRAAREQLNLSQLSLSIILDCERGTLTAYEAGTKKPNKQVIRMVDWLLQGWRPPEWPVEGQRGGFANSGHVMS